MARIETFRELEAWQISMELVVDCYHLTDRYPTDERYGLTRETRRSAVSIPSNIAEGHNRHARNAYLNHVNIALGSQAELESQLEIAVRLGYLARKEVEAFSNKLARVGQMLHGLQRSLESRR
jgi:four helix bundle protein